MCALPLLGRLAGLVVALGAVEHPVRFAQHLVRRSVAVARARLGDDFGLGDRVHVRPLVGHGVLDVRCEERRVGKKWGSTGRTRWSPEDSKNKTEGNTT